MPEKAAMTIFTISAPAAVMVMLLLSSSSPMDVMDRPPLYVSFDDVLAFASVMWWVKRHVRSFNFWRDRERGSRQTTKSPLHSITSIWFVRFFWISVSWRGVGKMASRSAPQWYLFHRRGQHSSECNSLGKFPGRKERESQSRNGKSRRGSRLFHWAKTAVNIMFSARAFITRRCRQKAAALAK